MSINLGIITERLQTYGGSEVYILECIKRWQHNMDIVVYTNQCNRKLLKEFDIDLNKVGVKILPKIKNKKHRFDLLESLVIRPRIWERHIGRHDLYFQYLFPAQMVRKSPSIWFAAEPLRMLYDLHHHEAVDESRIAFHVYPRMRYDNALKSDLNVLLQIVQELDRNTKIENLVTNSNMMGGYLETVYGRKPDLVAQPGINLPDDHNGPVDNKTAIFVGRLWEHKRVDLIIQAMHMVPDGNLLIVGDGPERSKLKKLSKSLGLRKRVRFLGNLSGKRLDELYRSVTCGIYTPTREPFGIMPLEAASYGMPVVVTQDGGYTEVLDRSCAHIVAPDPSNIADAINSLFSNHDQAKRMGACGRQRVENYTWDHTAEKLSKLFKQTLTGQRRVISNPGYRPLLGAHYYLWYGAKEAYRHWNEDSKYAAVTDTPLQGVYSSDNRDAISRHLTWVEEAGLDYLVINMQISSGGLDPMELKAVDLLFDIAASRNPDLSLCFMLSCDNANSESITESLEFLEGRYVSSTNYLRLDGKPVLWYFISESFIGHFYHQFSSLKEATDHYYRIAASGFCYTKYLPVQYSEFFDGWSLYSPLQISSEDFWEPQWEASYQDFLEDSDDWSLGVFTLCPGFDDTALTLSQRSTIQHRSIARDEGKIYKRMQDSCMNIKDAPDLIVITSFNEFHENTHIEPSESFGEKYLKLTRGLSDSLKSGGGKDLRLRGQSLSTGRLEN